MYMWCMNSRGLYVVYGLWWYMSGTVRGCAVHAVGGYWLMSVSIILATAKQISAKNTLLQNPITAHRKFSDCFQWHV